MTEIVLCSESFNSRIDRLFDAWKANSKTEGSPWQNVDAVVFVKGRQEDTGITSKTSAIHLWLFAFEFPDTLVVLTADKHTFIVTGPKKLRHLEQLKRENLHLLVKGNEEANKKAFTQINEHIEELSKTPKIARLRGKAEACAGDFGAQCDEALKGASEVPMDGVIGQVLQVKDVKEQEKSRLAGLLAARWLKDAVIKRIERILDSESEESHESIVNACGAVIDDASMREKWKTKYKLDPDLAEYFYCLVQSGTQFDLRITAPPSGANLHLGSGCVVCSLGVKYADYCASTSRTLLITPTADQKEVYKLALETQDVVIKHLKKGTKFSAVYEAAHSYVVRKKKEMGDKLTRTVGHTLGLEFRDGSFTLGPKCDTGVVENGMVFNVLVGFQGLIDVKRKKPFAIWLGDSVQITDSGEAQVLTSDCPSRLSHVCYELDEPDGAEPKDKKGDKPVSKRSKEADPAVPVGAKTSDSVVIGPRLRARHRSTNDATEQKIMMKKQMELRSRKLCAMRERFEEGGGDVNKKTKSVRKLSLLTSYANRSMLPPDVRPNKIYVDATHESVIVPIGGVPVPFHVSTIKNVTCQEEDKKTYTLRLNFQVPGSTTLPAKGDTALPELSSPNAIYIKELTYRSPDMRSTAKNIQDLIKRVKQKESLESDRREAVTQEPLQLKRDRRIVLKDLIVRPSAGGRRVTGVLDAHMNGLRFSSPKSDHVDINYSNIKHAIFQPVENELIVVIHFHLKHPIMLGKKKTVDVQFYTEAGSQADDLDQRKGSSYDPDETFEEQRERELRKRLNGEFKKWVVEVEKISKVDFDIPYRELAFHGVANKSTSLILPTVNSLVQLIEWPPFILSLQDIEIVSFERVDHGLRNFDIVFVFKDYTWKSISLIPVEYLDTLKKWLNQLDIVWYEGKQNLNWTAVIKQITLDLEGFIADGGYDIFLGDDTGPTGTVAVEYEDEDSDDDNDAAYEEAGDESEAEDSDTESSDEESLAEESDDASVQEMDSSEEEGLDWDELEEKAKREDRKRSYEGEEEEERKSKKRK